MGMNLIQDLPAEWSKIIPQRPTVSIVVTTYTTERMNDLLSLIDSIERMHTPDIELIIIIERAYESFQLATKKLGQCNFSSRVIFKNERLGISNARNLGIKHSSAAIVAFVDDDAILLEGWKTRLLEAFSSFPEAIGVVGPALPLWENPKNNWFPKEFYWMIGCSEWTGWKTRRKTRFGWGVNMAFRRSVFSTCSFADGFSKGANRAGKMGPVGDDTDFCFRATERNSSFLLFEPQVKVLHRVYEFRLSRHFTRRYAYWQGYTEAMFRLDNRVATARTSSQSHLIVGIIKDLVPGIFSDLVVRPNVAISKFMLLFDSFIFFALGFTSFRSTRVFSFAYRFL